MKEKLRGLKSRVVDKTNEVAYRVEYALKAPFQNRIAGGEEVEIGNTGRGWVLFGISTAIIVIIALFAYQYFKQTDAKTKSGFSKLMEIVTEAMPK